MLRLLSLIIIIGLGAQLSGCGCSKNSNSSAATSPEPTLQGLEISIEKETLISGLKTQAYTSARYSDNSSQDISAEAQWFSSDSTVASVDANGQITALQPGTSTIAAVLQSHIASVQLTVEDAQLIALRIIPGNLQLAQGIQKQFSAEGTYTNGQTTLNQDVTELVTWSSSAPNNISISNAPGSKGLATTIASGTAEINAALNNLTSSAPAQITAANLVRIEIGAPQTTVPANTKLQLQATGIFSDDSETDLSSQVSWSSANESLATINNTGLISTLAPGNVGLSLSYQGQTAAIALSISDASLAYIEISPSNPNLAAGSSEQLYATAIYTDDSHLDVTEQATWTSSDENIASIGNTSLNQGEITTIAAGKTTISAHFNDQTYQTSLTVTAALLKSIEIEPSNPSIAINTQQQFSVTGHYDNGMTRDLTEHVSWSSTNTSIAEKQASDGYFKGLTSGTSKIIAIMGKTTAFTELTVTAATLDSISLSPLDINIVKGFSTQLSAAGHFSDSSTQDISNSVIWQSSDQAVARISNANDDVGLLSSLATGNSTISASFSGISSSTSVTVNEAQLTSISLQLDNKQMLIGEQQAIKAIAHFSDSSSLDISSMVTWFSSDHSIASVSNAENDAKNVYALGSGSVTVTASLGGIDGSAGLSIIDDPNAPVSLSIVASPNVILNDATDSSTITVIVRPAGSSGNIADNTAINIVITEGASVSNQTINSSAGGASFVFTSNYAGFIKINATVGNISQSAYIYAAPTFDNVIPRTAYQFTAYDNNTLLAGSWFSQVVRNLSSRSFTIDQYQFNNGVQSETYPGTDFNNSQLSAGRTQTIITIMANDQIDDGISGELSLTDGLTGQQINIIEAFTTP